VVTGERRQRFFHMHVQKTAGTSLRKRVQHHFGTRAVYPDGSDGIENVKVVVSIPHLQERFRARGDEIRFVSGHFPLCTTELLDADFTTLAVLRHPVERTLSYLRHKREELPEGEEASLEEIYEKPWHFNTAIHNFMVKVLSLTPEEASEGWVMSHVEYPPERLERAKEGLASVDAIGLQERFEEFCGELTRRFGWDLGPPLRENLTGRAEVSDSFRARIAGDNAMDVELFEFATRLYEERLGESRRSSVPLAPARPRS
jgi:hypothetical protein